MSCPTKYTDCVKNIIDILSDLPLKWAEMIACNICNLSCTGQPDCNEVIDCQTLTELSTWVISEDKVCITYKNEKGVLVTRCFTIPDTGMYDADGTCLTEEWFNIDKIAKWQAIVDKFCDCCTPTTTTSTTTTTTEVPCTCGTYSGWYNIGPFSPTRLVTIRSCDEGNPSEGIEFNPGDTIEFCACYYGNDPLEAILDFNEVKNITFLGDSCFTTTSTTTTTSTSTTTTTTAAPTTTTTTSTTTTTTVAGPCPLCIRYGVQNTSSEAIVGSYYSCSNVLQGFIIAPFGSLIFCACENSISTVESAIITDVGGSCSDIVIG
jgi:hypothetical protein